MFSIQLKNVFSQLLGTISISPDSDRLDRLLRQFLGIYIPLVGQPRLDHHAAAVTKGCRDLARLGVLLDFLALLGLGNMRDKEALFLEPLDDQFARAVFAITLESMQAEVFLRHEAVSSLANIRFAIEHVEHLGGRNPCALAYIEVVEIVAWGDLYRARAKLGIGVLVSHD